MKKRVAFVLTIAMIFPACMAFAGEANDPMAVTLISGPEEEEAEQVSLDDIKAGKDIEIDGFGTFTPLDYRYVDKTYINGDWYQSGEEAEYGSLFVDILNTNVNAKDYLADVEVKAIYDELYEYAGWAYQLLDNKDDNWRGKDNDRYISIEPMYMGHYVFGATLPNAIVNGKKELKYVIKIDGNELTYYANKSS